MSIDSIDRWKDYPQQHDFVSNAPESDTSLGILLSAIGERKRVLDIGCAGGYLGQVLQSRQCDTVGIDINPKAAEDARKYCSRVIVADLDEASVTDLVGNDTFDVIVFADILEHLRNPLRLLDDARALIREGGYAVISLPNIAHGAVRLALLNGSFDYQEFGILDDTHMRFFTRKSAEELFLAAGYRLEDIGRTNVPLFGESDLVPSVREQDFTAEAIAAIRRDPECETLQFILRAYPLSNEIRFRTLSKRFLEVNTELATIRTRAKREEETVKALSAQLAVTNEELAKTREFLATANAEMLRSQEAYRTLEAEAREIEFLRHRIHDTENLQSSANAAVKAAHRFEIELVRAQERLVMQTARAAEFEQKYLELQAAVPTTKIDATLLDALQSELAKSKELLAVQDSEMASLQESRRTLQSEVLARDTQIAEFSQALAESKELLAFQDSETASLQESRRTLQSEVLARDTQIAEFSRALASAEQDLDRVRALLLTAQSEKDVLRSQASDASALQAEIETLRAEGDEYQRTIENLYGEWNAAETALVAHRSKATLLQAALEEAKEVSLALSTSLTAHESEIAQNRTRIFALETQIAQSEAAITTKERAIAELSQQLTNERTDHARDRDRLATLNGSVADLENRLLEQMEAMASRARSESVQIATLIDLVQSGKFWWLKRFFQRIRR